MSHEVVTKYHHLSECYGIADRNLKEHVLSAIRDRRCTEFELCGAKVAIVFSSSEPRAASVVVNGVDTLTFTRYAVSMLRGTCCEAGARMFNTFAELALAPVSLQIRVDRHCNVTDSYLLVSDETFPICSGVNAFCVDSVYTRRDNETDPKVTGYLVTEAAWPDVTFTRLDIMGKKLWTGTAESRVVAQSTQQPDIYHQTS